MKEFKVTQTRSSSGRTKEVLETLNALGLGRIGKSSVHRVSPSIKGMVQRVLHLVELEQVEGK